MQLHSLFFLAIFAFSGACNTGENLFETKVIDNRYSIVIAKSMQREKNHSPVLARLYKDTKRGEFITVTDHLKESGTTQLRTYLETLESTPKLIGLPIKNPQYGKPIFTKINGHNAVKAAIYATVMLDKTWQKAWGLLVYIEGKTHIYQLTGWLVLDSPGEDDTRLHQIVNSFEELKEEVY